MIPIPVSFSGMPNTRWWTFEDVATNFGDIDASTTDLAKLLFMEFALVYANDWFVIPYTLPAGAIATIRGVRRDERIRRAVLDRRRPAPAPMPTGSAGACSRSTCAASRRRPTRACCCCRPPRKSCESPPTEDIQLIRDEVANMVWGVEYAIPLPSGESQRGIEAARQTRALFEAQLAARLGGPGAPPPHHVPPPAVAPIRYQVMNTVPENWIPFIPVHVPGDNRDDPAAARRPAPHPRRRPRSARQGAATHCAAARGARPVAGADLTSCSRRRCRAPARG